MLRAQDLAPCPTGVWGDSYGLLHGRIAVGLQITR